MQRPTEPRMLLPSNHSIHACELNCSVRPARHPERVRERWRQTRHTTCATSLSRACHPAATWPSAAASPTRALVLATISFALSFAAWGLVGGLASVFTGLYRLTASQTALLVAVPVLLGSLARLPMGMLTDRFGGRLVFTALLAFSVAGRLRRSADRQLRFAARRGVPHRHGRIVVRGRRGLRVPLDPGGSAGHGARRLRPGDDGAVAGGLRRPGGGGPPGLGDGVSRHRRAAPGLGGGLLPAGAESPAARAVPPRSPR